MKWYNRWNVKIDEMFKRCNDKIDEIIKKSFAHYVHKPVYTSTIVQFAGIGTLTHLLRPFSVTNSFILSSSFIKFRFVVRNCLLVLYSV